MLPIVYNIIYSRKRGERDEIWIAKHIKMLKMSFKVSDPQKSRTSERSEPQETCMVLQM
jgi:hypothetical protein